MAKYNAPAGRPGQRKENLPDRPHVMTPYVNVEGAMVEAKSVIWNSAKQAFWVDFGDGFRDWFAEPDVVWQRKLIFPES